VRRIRLVALAVATALPKPCGATVNESARWIAVDYRERQQVTIPCSSGLLCTVSFARGEVLGDYFISDPNHWKLLPAYSQNRAPSTAIGQLVVQATTPGLRANMVIFARNSRRVYHLLFLSTRDARPLYASFVYPSPSRAHEVRAAAPASRPTPGASFKHVGDAACAAESDGYIMDSGLDRRGRPDSILMSRRPVRVCHDFGHVYVFMPESNTAETDLPVPYEESEAGINQTNYHYYTADRLFVIDTFRNVVLRITSGTRVLDMHLRRKGP
jgi:hypothetical protein